MRLNSPRTRNLRALATIVLCSSLWANPLALAAPASKSKPKKTETVKSEEIKTEPTSKPEDSSVGSDRGSDKTPAEPTAEELLKMTPIDEPAPAPGTDHE